MDVGPLERETTVQRLRQTRFLAGQRILATRSGHSGGCDSLAEVLQVRATETAEVYRVRWQDGLETFFVPGPEAHDRRQRDDGPPPGMPDRRRA
jgi:Domain of unknown function (DUF1918)